MRNGHGQAAAVAALFAAAFAASEVLVVHVQLQRDSHSFSMTDLVFVAGLYLLEPGALIAAAASAVVLTLLFGLAQWRDELRKGYYTPAQAVAPTKIWHQVVVYPVLGYWLWTAVIGGLSAPGGATVWTGKAPAKPGSGA